MRVTLSCALLRGILLLQVSALASAVACGVMIACSFDLVHEGQPYGGVLVIAGVVLGTTPLLPLFSHRTRILPP